LSGYGETYIYAHLAAPVNRRKVPQREGMRRLMLACAQTRGAPSKLELYEYFYELPQEQAA
jgi:hypothetical protein